MTILLALVACACLGGAAVKLLAEGRAAADIEALRERVRGEETVVIRIELDKSAVSTADLPQPAGNAMAATPTATIVPTRSPEELEKLAAYAELRAENKEFAGWIVVPDTQADCPVMYSPERKWYYYQRDFEGNHSRRGMLFIDERGTPDGRNVIIYGHNMKSGSMFGELSKYLAESFALSHRELSYDTLEELGTYRVISVYQTTAGGKNAYPFYLYAGLESGEELADYGAEAISRSLFDFGERVTTDDRLVTLVTCSYFAEDGRLIVVAKRVS